MGGGENGFVFDRLDRREQGRTSGRLLGFFGYGRSSTTFLFSRANGYTTRIKTSIAGGAVLNNPLDREALDQIGLSVAWDHGAINLGVLEAHRARTFFKGFQHLRRMSSSTLTRLSTRTRALRSFLHRVALSPLSVCVCFS